MVNGNNTWYGKRYNKKSVHFIPNLNGNKIIKYPKDINIHNKHEYAVIILASVFNKLMAVIIVSAVI